MLIKSNRWPNAGVMLGHWVYNHPLDERLYND